MLRIILVGLLLMLIARAFWRVIDGIVEGVTGDRRRPVPQPTRLFRDPVCGTHVAPASAPWLPAAAGRVYFCSERCRDEYRLGASRA